MTMEPQQASPMSKMDGTKLPSTPWPFWTCIFTSSTYVKMTFWRIFLGIFWMLYTIFKAVLVQQDLGSEHLRSCIFKETHQSHNYSIL